MAMEDFREPTANLESRVDVEWCEMGDVMSSEEVRAFTGAYNQAAARDPMAERSQFLSGLRIPEAKGR